MKEESTAGVGNVRHSKNLHFPKCSAGLLRPASLLGSRRRFEIRHEEKNGQQPIAARDVNVSNVHAVLGIKNESRNEVAEFFENTDEHQQPEAHGICRDDEKHELPSKCDSGKAVIEQWMGDGRRIFDA